MNTQLLALAGLLALGTAAAHADDTGYNTTDGDTLTIGTDTNTGGEAPGDAEQMQSIQQGFADLKASVDTHNAEATGNSGQ